MTAHSLRTLTFAIGLAAGMGATAALADHHGGPVRVSGEGAQALFTDADGMTLYTFDNDTPGVSNCTGGCATAWPPLIGEAGMALPDGFSLITRSDGGQQIAYENEPLYLWMNDRAPGDTTGDGVNGVWHIARP